MKKILLLTLLLHNCAAQAQSVNGQQKAIARKNSLLHNMNNDRNKRGPGYGILQQNLAVTYAELNNKDSALYFLNASLSSCPAESQPCEDIWNPNILGFFQFQKWHKEIVWKQIEDKIKQAFKKSNANLKDQDLAYELLLRSGIDQSYREYASVLGLDEKLQKEARRADSANVAFIKKVVREKGYPSISMVGSQASEAAFFLVQHADKDIAFQKEVLKKMKQLPAGDVDGESLALMTDRISVKENGTQIYGTQFKDFNSKQLYPIVDSANVDARRKEMGLSTLSDYMKSINSF